MPGLKTCENCGREIGKLEIPHEHQGHVVCARCLSNLQEELVPAAAVASGPATSGLMQELEEIADRKAATSKPLAPACPGCGKRIVPIRKDRGSVRDGVLLLAAGIGAGLLCAVSGLSLPTDLILLLLCAIPGILYLTLYRRSIYVCSACGIKRGDAIR
jgi:DNA-directed RNA polymerase subunit RPC12/RpoP